VVCSPSLGGGLVVFPPSWALVGFLLVPGFSPLFFVLLCRCGPPIPETQASLFRAQYDQNTPPPCPDPRPYPASDSHFPAPQFPPIFQAVAPPHPDYDSNLRLTSILLCPPSPRGAHTLKYNFFLSTLHVPSAPFSTHSLILRSQMALHTPFTFPPESPLLRSNIAQVWVFLDCPSPAHSTRKKMH